MGKRSVIVNVLMGAIADLLGMDAQRVPAPGIDWVQAKEDTLYIGHMCVIVSMVITRKSTLPLYYRDTHAYLKMLR